MSTQKKSDAGGFKKKLLTLYTDLLFFFVWKITFFLHSLRPADKKLILFVANNDTSMPDNYKSLHDLAEKKGYRCKVLYKYTENSSSKIKNILGRINYDITFQKYYARAKATFVYDYFFPAYANKPKKGARLIQIWHACGAFKRWGYSTTGSSWGLKGNDFKKYNIHKTYTDVVTSSEYIIPKYAEAFDAPESIIRPLGTPRTDVYFKSGFAEECRASLEGMFPQIKGKKVVLWAPTFRGNSLNEAHNTNVIDIEKMKNALGDEYILLIKLHPHVAKAFTIPNEKELKDHVINISKQVEIEKALCAADILVSDYSSLIFEYSLLERPMIFYAYDLDEYKNGRSFYYDYESFVPGRIVKTEKELAKAILSAYDDFDKAKIDDFKNKFMSSCDGSSTARVFEALVENR